MPLSVRLQSLRSLPNPNYPLPWNRKNGGRPLEPSNNPNSILRCLGSPGSLSRSTGATLESLSPNNLKQVSTLKPL